MVAAAAVAGEVTDVRESVGSMRGERRGVADAD